MSGFRTFAQGLYSGQVSYNFVGRRKLWYVISGIILAITLGSLIFRGLNLGIEFRGGSEFQVPSAQCSVQQAQDTTNSVVDGQAVVTEEAEAPQARLTLTLTLALIRGPASPPN